MPNKTRPLPELLAPAGSPDALAAAIEGGADAVYFGAVRFSARMRAKNFTEEQLADAIALTRAHGVRSYITVNTRVRDGEMEELLDTVSLLNEAGADALIVADLGVAARIRERFPDLPLHASTQFSGASSADAALLASLGFSRMVCPRELSLAELSLLCKNSPLEIEMFIHGAHCVSYSGQCMLSYVMGGRSGNRGECAQPCRLPYKVTGKDGTSPSEYPLSLKDMCLAGHIREILLSGVSSLKIEGRQKSPDYVFGVTRAYRTLLTEGRDATKEEIAHLSALFSRDGFSDGYFRKKYGGMLGIRRAADTERSKTAEPFGGLTKTVPLTACLSVRADEPIALTLSDGVHSARVTGDIPLPAKTAPLTVENARKNIARLGGTPFSLQGFSAAIEDGLFCTPAQLNVLRRDALAKLNAPPVRRSLPAEVRKDPLYTPPQTPRFTAEFLSPEQIPDEAESFFDEIYLPLHARVRDYGVSLPEYAPDGGTERMKAALSLAAPSSVLAHSPAQIRLAREMGIPATASLRLNVFNADTARVLYSLGADAVTPSPELPLGAMRALPGPKSVIVYGRLPLMLTLRCAISDGGSSCRFSQKGGYAGEARKDRLCLSSLKDRTGTAFPLVGMYDCTNVLYNSVPLWMGDRQNVLHSLQAGRWHFLFTTETKDEVRKILSDFAAGRLPEGGPFRRLK